MGCCSQKKVTKTCPLNSNIPTKVIFNYRYMTMTSVMLLCWGNSFCKKPFISVLLWLQLKHCLPTTETAYLKKKYIGLHYKFNIFFKRKICKNMSKSYWGVSLSSGHSTQQNYIYASLEGSPTSRAGGAMLRLYLCQGSWQGGQRGQVSPAQGKRAPRIETTLHCQGW